MDQFDYYSPLNDMYDGKEIEFNINNNEFDINMEFDDLNNYLINLKNNIDNMNKFNLLHNHMIKMHQIILNSSVNKDSKKALITKLKQEMNNYEMQKQ